MKVFKKIHGYTQSPKNPAPSVLSEIKWLASNIQVYSLVGSGMRMGRGCLE